MGGGSAIAVIRLRGPGVDAFLRAHFSKVIVACRCVHGELRDGERVIDDAVAVLDSENRFIDLNLHGGAAVIDAVFALAAADGFVRIEPTPQTVADFVFEEAGSILQREMLASLPLAETDLALRTLLAQPDRWQQAIENGSLKIAEIAADRSLWWLLHPPRVAIVGEPNVGKSTLANALFGQKRSITADIPGTTRDWVSDIADLNGLRVMLLDTPGQRETVDAIEQAAIAAARSEIATADLQLLVLDAGETLPAIAHRENQIVVLNKIDRNPNAQWPSAIRVSAESGEGLEELRDAVAANFGVSRVDDSRPHWWTLRQQQILQQATCDPEQLRELFHASDLAN